MTANTRLIHAIADALIGEYDEEATEWLEDGGCCSACNCDPQYHAISIGYRADRRATHAPNNTGPSGQRRNMTKARLSS